MGNSKSSSMKSGRRDGWSDEEIANVKAEVKTELDAVMAEGGEPAAIRTAMHRLAHFSDDPSEDAQLRVYIYMMSALVRFVRCGKGLTYTQTQAMVDRAYTCLKLARLRLDNPRVTYLYGDLHAVMSQVRKLQGKYFLAAWEHQLAMRHYRDMQKRSADFQAHNAAVRALRLGDTTAAIQLFGIAEELADNPEKALYSAFSAVRAIRLCGDLTKAAEKLNTIKQTYALEGTSAGGWEWEHTLMQAQHTADLEPLVAMTQRGKSHFHGHYIAEAILWIHAGQLTRLMSRVNKATSIKRSKVINTESSSELVDVLVVIESLYDTEYPIEIRLQKLGRTLGDIHTLNSVEHELLVWLAASRWLYRSRLWQLARTTFSEYRNLSLRVSEGVTQDAMGLASDMLGGEWEHNMPFKMVS